MQAGASADEVNFSRDIRPLFNEHCVACHGGVKQVRELSFVYAESVFNPAESGEVPVVPGKPGVSEVMRRVTHPDEDERMPPPEHGPRLSEEKISDLRQWIKSGAPWEKHWAFEPPERQSLPEVEQEEWARQRLDYFVLNRFEQEGLEPSEEAGRLEWLRRVTFDLTGLPPTPEEVEAFMSDRSPEAYKRVVDRLLASPAFGERWAAMWMDLARYADSQGYEKDGLRTMWPYRDWLIRAINNDLPYDEFTIRQLAGDLLQDPSLRDLVATGFHRNTPTNTEGGTDDEEFRVAAVIDRVNTTWQVWQGVTFGCVQCHSHPYDPIQHEEYYQFYSIFNTTRDWDLRSEKPRLAVPKNEKKFDEARELDRRLKELREAQLERTEQLARNSSLWEALKPTFADSTKQTQLEVVTGKDGQPELHTKGTVSHDSRFTLEFALPDDVEELTALRIDVLPQDPEEAKFTPELGFTLSQVRGQIVTDETSLRLGEGTEDSEQKTLTGEIDWAQALGDELEPFEDPQATLDPDKLGWGAMPRLMYSRHLVLVPESPVSIPKGARLRLVIRQERAPNDLDPLVMNRSRYSVSADDAWTKLLLDETFQNRNEEIKRLAEERASIDCARMPVMQAQYEHLKRQTAMFVRGNWLSKGKPVSPGIPDTFGVLPEEEPENRLELARWLVSDSNPLTARVAVNRLWERLFGAGLVETTEDFGTAGASPSHPELLDDLAVRFRTDLDWSRKALLREIVLSATYRQTARVGEELKKHDPRNRLLSRGPRNRLTAEMIRDNALASGGLLSRKMGGPSVMPPQPDGIWRAARSSLKWEESKGEDKYRRALYTFWRRSSPYPSMMTFDAPSRLVCSTRREATNTPLQALVTLNDPVYMEAAVGLAKRARNNGGERPEEHISHAYELVVGKAPSEADLQDLVELYKTGLDEYEADPESAKKVAEGPQTAALAIVANAILNLDKVLTR